MLKKMEKAGLITRSRSKEDERVVIITITQKGEELYDAASEIPIKMSQCVKIDSEEAQQLYTLLNKMIENFNTFQNEKL